MGNEKSALKGLEIEEKSVEITDFWVHYTARVHGYGARRVSLFISEPSLHYTANFGNPSPLEKAAKVNLNSLYFYVRLLNSIIHESVSPKFRNIYLFIYQACSLIV